jgi:L-aminopeptidase/D-esterase-like protein
LSGEALEFDLPGVLVGVAEYDEGPTGCTAFLFGDGAMCENDIRGGSVGFTGDYRWVAGICLAGGSLLGTEAAGGVAAAIWEQRGKPTDWMRIPAVSGAIIFDFHTGRKPVYPDAALGRAAAEAAKPGIFPIGARGAGRSAGVGQGAAFGSHEGSRVAVFTLVNALGAVVDREGSVVYGGNRARPEGGDERTVRNELAARMSAPAAPGNTTLTVVVTDAQVSSYVLRQLGRQVHTSMARAIQPFHTVADGDVLWAVTTRTGPQADPVRLGIFASELAWDAVLAAATPRA